MTTNNTHETESGTIFTGLDVKVLKKRMTDIRLLEGHVTNNLLIKLRRSYKPEYLLGQKKSEHVNDSADPGQNEADLAKLSEPHVLNQLSRKIAHDGQAYRFWQEDILAEVKNIQQQIKNKGETEDGPERSNPEIVELIEQIKSSGKSVTDAYDEIGRLFNSKYLKTEITAVQVLSRSDVERKYTNQSNIKRIANRLFAWIGSSDAQKEKISETARNELSETIILSHLRDVNTSLENLVTVLGTLKAELIEIARAKQYLFENANLSFSDIRDFFIQMVNFIVTPLGKPTLFGGFLLMVLFASFSFGVKEQTGIFIGQFQNWHSWLEVLIQHAHILVFTIILSVFVFMVIVGIEYYRSKNPKQLKHQEFLYAHTYQDQEKLKEALGARMIILVSFFCVVISAFTGYVSGKNLEDHAIEVASENSNYNLKVLRLGNAFLTHDGNKFSAHTATDFDELLKFKPSKNNEEIDATKVKLSEDDKQALLSQQQQSFDQIQMDQRVISQKLQEQLFRLTSAIETENKALTFNFQQPAADYTNTDQRTIIIKNTNNGIFTLPLAVFHSANDKTLEFSDKLFIALMLVDYLEPARACKGIQKKGLLRITAYADSACYYGNCDHQSHFENLELANDRIKAVYDFLMTEIKSSEFLEQVSTFYGSENANTVVSNISNMNSKLNNEFNITRNNWSSAACEKSNSDENPGACVGERDYLQIKAGINDRDQSTTAVVNSDGYNEQKGEFNRRAEITLMSAPNCEGEVSFASES